jgi:hypothetical protein
VKIGPIRKHALSLEAVTEEPHHHYSSFRVKGRIFVTVPPDEEAIHVFVQEEERDQALALYPEYTEKLLWGGKVVGLRVTLGPASPATVKALVTKAYESHIAKNATPKVAKSSNRSVRPCATSAERGL